MMAVRRCVDVARRAFLLLCLQNLALVAFAIFFSQRRGGGKEPLLPKSPTDSVSTYPSSLTDAVPASLAEANGKTPPMATTSVLARMRSSSASFFGSSFISKRSIVESHALPVGEEVVHSTQQKRPEHATTRDTTNGFSVTARTPAKLQGSNAVEAKLQLDFCPDRDLTHEQQVCPFAKLLFFVRIRKVGAVGLAV